MTTQKGLKKYRNEAFNLDLHDAMDLAPSFFGADYEGIGCYYPDNCQSDYVNCNLTGYSYKINTQNGYFFLYLSVDLEEYETLEYLSSVLVKPMVAQGFDMKMLSVPIIFLFIVFVPFYSVYYYIKYKRKQIKSINKHYAELLRKNDRLN